MSRVPAIFLLLALSVEIFCFEKISHPLLPVVACLVAAGFCMVFYSGLKNEFTAAMTLVVVTFFCSVWILFSLSAAPSENMKIESKAVVTDARNFGKGQALIVKVKVKVKTDGGNFVVKLSESEKREKYKLGEIIQISGWVKNFSVKDDVSFREDLFWKARGAGAEIAVSKISRTKTSEFGLHLWRQTLLDYFENFPHPLSAYLNAMWTGIRDDELRAQHSRWGTVHLLAISGFHVGILVLIAGAIFFFVPQKGRLIFISLVLWLYIAGAGAPPSAMRAGVMFQIAIFARFLGRPVNGLNCVSGAAVLILTHSPFLFWDIGFRLSVVAAMTITALAATMRRETLYYAVTPAVFATTYPLIAPIFESVPAAGVFINFFAVPFFAFAFPAMSFVAVFGIFVEPIQIMLKIFAHSADMLAAVVPFQIGWNFYLAFACVAFLIFIVTRASFSDVAAKIYR